MTGAGGGGWGLIALFPSRIISEHGQCDVVYPCPTEATEALQKR